MSLFDDVRLETAEYRLLRELFNEHCGIVFGPEARPVVERRLRERLAALGLASFSEYYQLLRYDERGRAELDEAIDLITINETYFFREVYQLRSYQTEILPMLRTGSQARDRLSVWSAGCSTGEEVYSVAMLTREASVFAGRQVRIFGSDISRRCVAAARRGIYGPSSFRATPSEFRRRYFLDRQDGMHVTDELRAMCQFGHLNLLDVSRASVVGRVDVIFCRNVLIYFDEASRRRVIEMFYERLLPGGFLLLGHSESLLNISTAFELVHLSEDLVYRKPVSSTRFLGGSGSSPAPAYIAPKLAPAPPPPPPPPPPEIGAHPRIGMLTPPLGIPVVHPSGKTGPLPRVTSGQASPPARPAPSPTPPIAKPIGKPAGIGGKPTPNTPFPAIKPAPGGTFKPQGSPRPPIVPGKPGPGNGGDPGDKR